MAGLTEKIVSRAERKFEKGDNHFIARSAMASLALFFTDSSRDIIRSANERIIQVMEERGAEAAIYAVEMDLGNGYEHSGDVVLIAEREGVPTGQLPVEPTISGAVLIIREETPGFASSYLHDFYRQP